MIDAAVNAYQRLLVGWLDLVRRSAVAVVALALTAAVGAAAFAFTHMRINTDTTDMLSSELPFRQQAKALKQAFPQFSDNIVVVVDGETRDLANDAADALAVRLRRSPELFGRVFDPAGEPFFRRNGLLYLDTDDLEELADRLAEAQPFLGTLWRDPSLRGLSAMLELAIDEMLEGDGDVAIEIARVLDSMADVAEAQAQGRFRHLSWHALMTGGGGDEADEDTYRRLILIQPKLDFGALLPGSAAIAALRALAAEMELEGGQGARLRLTGSVALRHEELKSVEEGMGVAAALSLTLVVVVLFWGLGSARLAAAIVATLVIGLVWTAGFALAAVGQLNLISVAFGVLFIGLSVDFGIHFGLRYKEGIDGGADHATALGEAAAGIGGALTLCAVAAAIGFFSFLPTDYLGLAELGLIAGAGMFIALFANLTVLPALLTLLPLTPSAGKPRHGQRGALLLFIRGHPRAVAWGALMLGIAAAALLPEARFDFDPLNLKDRKSESVSTLFDLMADSHTSPYSIAILAPDLDAATALGARLSALAEVDATETLADFVPEDQEDKLEIIEDMALFLAPSLGAGRRRTEPPAASDNRAALAGLRMKLARLAESAKDRPTGDAARRLLAALSALDAALADDAALKNLETRLLSELPGRLAALRRSLTAGPVILDDLPEVLRRRQVAADGRARLTVYPKEDVHQRQALERFVAAVRGLAPEAAGSPVVILEAGNTVVAAFAQAAALAVGLISLLLAVLLRRARDVVLVFAPLLLAALLTIAASVLLGMPFNFANVIVLPLLFGLGVASGIHLVTRERDEAGVEAVMKTSTPRAVVFSALTTIGSFGSIALSNHPGTSSMGALLTSAITLTLVCTLVVLPALMALRPVVGEAPSP